MKALTLTQPWASLVAIGAKTLETRSWRTHHRGRLAIHAAKGFPKECRDVCRQRVVYQALWGHRPTAQDVAALPRGVIVATTNLVEVYPTSGIVPPPGEVAFGDFSDGRWAWCLDDLVKLDPFVKAMGAQGIWNWEPGLPVR